jgi:hypothetical protein
MSDKTVNWGGDNSEISEEEHKNYLAGLGNIAHRHKLKPGFWDKMEDISIEGAALYSFGIDPSAIQAEMELPDDNALDELPRDYRERLEIIKSAVRAGTIIKRAPINGSDPGGWDDHTRISKASFLKWCKANPKSCKPAEAIADYPEYQTEPVVRAHTVIGASEDLPTKERESMLMLIIGMAICFYGYDPKSKRSAVTGELPGSIHADLEKAGISFDVGTIRKYLKEAKELLPPQ